MQPRITISSIEACNFKSFYGRCSIDLRPREGRPLVLIGGENGRGKTSLHEAINYTLYSVQDELPQVATKPDYVRAVTERLNRRALDEGESEFWVGVSLEVTEGGRTRNVHAQRRWEFDRARRSVDDQLTLQIDGRPTEFPEYEQDYLRSLVPPRIAPFFFFDGERIQEFAEDNGHERRMVQAIEDMLHINTYKLLGDDLKKYVIEHLERTELRESEAEDYFQLQGEEERISGELERVRRSIVDAERKIRLCRGEAAGAEADIRRVAGEAARSRGELLAERDQLAEQLDSAKARVEELFAKAAPVLLAGPLAEKLERALRTELSAAGPARDLEQLKLRLTRLHDSVFSPGAEAVLAMRPEQAAFYSDRFWQAAAEIFELETGPAPLLHDLGGAERDQILRRLESGRSDAQLLERVMDDRERAVTQQRDLEVQLKAMPADPAIEEKIRRAGEAREEAGRLEDEVANHRERQRKLESDLASCRRSVEDRRRRRLARTQTEKVIALAQSCRDALDSFVELLAPEKLKLLQQRLNEMYGRLKRPEDPVRDITIEDRTWRVVARDREGRPLERRVFSAGMKQMFALSLLWALAKASRFELPIIVDTPLGRLDGRNREALCRNYFPNAGHQVVLLSTDQEVDRTWFEALRPYVARQYVLDHNRDTQSTEVRPGYFF